MDKVIINQSLLEKDIEQIKFYSNEEVKKLNNICTKLEEGSSKYNSENTTLLLNNISMLKKNIYKLFEKRTKYTDVLYKVIIQYKDLSNKTKIIFDRDV